MENIKQAIVNGRNLHISTKHAIAICRFLKGRKINESISLLEDVIKMKRAIPFKGEIPHKKGIPARYPVKAAKIFIKLLKSLSANATQRGLDLDKIKIHGIANRASRARKPGRIIGRRFKRTSVLLIAKEND